jgi:hypothetical protein
VKKQIASSMHLEMPGFNLIVGLMIDLSEIQLWAILGVPVPSKN